ncbi:hypothetical protein [Pseudomonas sp. DY-1]|uniref:hypothetical protein n=1 Tax=Pseudomonas sp. DY-1 TaxID=1755504 RepID=UPI0013C5017A|nr:hypothetical protein [Pseudomonas sp. DY-1]
MEVPWLGLWIPSASGIALTWAQYLLIAGFMVGALGVGVAWGQFRLGWKEIIDASSA